MESTVKPLASVRCRYFNGAVFNNPGAGAVCARVGDKTPGETASTALINTARTNKPDIAIAFMVPFPIGLYSYTAVLFHILQPISNEKLDISAKSFSLEITMSRFLRFGSADALPAHAAVFLCWTSVLAVEQAGNALTHEGWTIAADTNRACLTIQHTRLGTILQEVHLNLEIDGTLGELKQWKADTSVPGRLVVRTLVPATTWSFEPARDRLTISSTAPGAVLTDRKSTRLN